MSRFKPKVVYVDDENDNLVIGKMALAKEFDVITFDTPAEALLNIAKIDPMIILSDITMPLMNGLEFLEVAQQICPLAKRVVITGNSDEALVIDAIKRTQIFDFIKKPIKNDTLMLSMTNARESFQKAEAESRIKKKALSPDLMEHPSWLHKITHQLKTAFDAMPQYKVTNRQFEDWSVLIHLAMSAEKRYYHNTEHLFDVWENLSDPYARLAVLFHDVVYAQIDKNSIHGMLPKIVDILGPMVPGADLKLTRRACVKS